MNLPVKSSKKPTSINQSQLLEIPVFENNSVGSQLSYLDDLESSSDGELFKKKNSKNKKYSKFSQDHKFDRQN